MPYALFKDKQKRKAVSGEARAAKDRVKFDVPWPHEYAQVKSLNYSDKDFGLTQLVRGEVFIMHNIEKSVTSTLRQKHLINLLYLAEKFPFSEIKDFHAEVLRSIERGHKTWSQTFSEEQGRTLVSPLPRHLNKAWKNHLVVLYVVRIKPVIAIVQETISGLMETINYYIFAGNVCARARTLRIHLLNIPPRNAQNRDYHIHHS